MDQLDPMPVRGTEGTAEMAGRGPFFSPDGLWIGFWQGGQIKKVAITGGAPIVVCAAGNPFGVSWATDNTILYGQSAGQIDGKGAAGIWRVSSAGGTPERLVQVEPGEIAAQPQMLPGNRAILFTIARLGDWETAHIAIQSLDTGSRRVVLERGGDARYVPTGHLIYALDGTLFAVPFDVNSMAVTGTPVPIVEDVAQQNITSQFAISNTGALVYVPRDSIVGSQAERTLVWVDRRGRETPIAAPPRAYVYPRLAPDGTRVAFEVRDQENDIWTWDLVHETLTRLTFGRMIERYAIWTPDGRTVIFSSGEIGGPTTPRSLFRRRSDGTGAVEQLTQSTAAQYPQAVTPDGAAVIVREQRPPSSPGSSSQSDFILLPLVGERSPRPLLPTPFVEYNAELSPDGHWLAYESNESGKYEVYVRPFPNVEDGKWQASTDGGAQPLWAHSGRELFYESSGTLMRVPVTIGSTFVPGTPQKIVGAGYVLRIPGQGAGRMYDVSSDGQRFLMLKEGHTANERPAPARMILVQDWFEEVAKRVPTHR
jgi:serine/threonine-protein kinase